MKRTLVVLAAIVLLSAATVSAQTLSGREIIQKAKDRPDGDSRHSQMTLKLINKNNKIRERKVESYSIDIGKDKKTIMFFLYPGDVKGTGFLTWDYDEIGKEDDK
jgi:archaellum component FlaG (FlaF/FlaG flagellin family)